PDRWALRSRQYVLGGRQAKYHGTYRRGVRSPAERVLDDLRGGGLRLCEDAGSEGGSILGRGPYLPPGARPGVHVQPCRCDFSARSAAPEPAPHEPPSLDHRARQERLRAGEAQLATPLCLGIEE